MEKSFQKTTKTTKTTESHNERVHVLEESLEHFKEHVEQQLKAQKSLIELQIDSARRDLELGIRSIRQQDHSDLFQQAERVAVAAVGKAVRECLSSEVASLHRSLRLLNDTLEERLRLLEQRLEQGEKRHVKRIEEVVVHMEQWELAAAEDGGRLEPEVAAQVPELLKCWGQGKFRSQAELAAYYDGKLSDMRGGVGNELSRVKGEIQQMLTQASDSMGQRIEEQVVLKMQPMDNRLTSTDIMLRNLLKANEAREAQAQAQAQAQVLEKERPKSPEPLALASPAPVSPAPAPAEDFKVWLTQQVRGITQGERPGEELQGRELLSWMQTHVRELVSDLLPPAPSSPAAEQPSEAPPVLPVLLEPTDLPSQPDADAATTTYRLDGLEDKLLGLAEALSTLESARLPGRLGLLEASCLEERLALLESYGGRPVSSAQGVPGAAQLLALRDETQKLRTRVAMLEGLVQIPEVEKEHRHQAESPSPRSQMEDLNEDEFKREMMNLWRAVSGDQRTLDLLTAKLEDGMKSFTTMQSRFESTMPQMLQLLSELLRATPGAGPDSEDALLRMQRLLYGDGAPFVSPLALREAMGNFEAFIRAELQKLREDLTAAMEDKARAEDLDFLAEQLRMWQGQVQLLRTSLEKLLIASESTEDAAIWRRPLLPARCVSCDRKVDVRGMLYDRDAHLLPQSVSPERVQSARRPQSRAEGRRLPAID